MVDRQADAIGPSGEARDNWDAWSHPCYPGCCRIDAVAEFPRATRGWPLRRPPIFVKL